MSLFLNRYFQVFGILLITLNLLSFPVVINNHECPDKSHHHDHSHNNEEHSEDCSICSLIASNTLFWNETSSPNFDNKSYGAVEIESFSKLIQKDFTLFSHRAPPSLLY